MKRQMHLSLLVVVVIGFFAGCDSQKSPSQVVQAALTAANEGRYSEADGYLSSATTKAMASEEVASAGGSKKVWDEMTQHGTITQVEILKEDKRGEGALVSFRIHFKNEPTVDSEWNLRLEDGRWKLVWD